VIDIAELAVAGTAIVTSLPKIVRSLPALFSRAADVFRSGKTLLTLLSRVGGKGGQAPVVQSDQILFRGDGRSVQSVFQNGLRPRAGATESNLDRYVNGGQSTSIFVGGSRAAYIAERYAKETGVDYVFVIRTRAGRGIDVNATLGRRSTFANDREVVMPYGFEPEDVLGYYRVVGDKRVFVPNPIARID
jgi:hypothetical protein